MDHDSDISGTNRTNQAELADGYRQMAADIEHEIEAEEWAEALVGDVSDVDKETAND